MQKKILDIESLDNKEKNGNQIWQLTKFRKI